MEPSSDEVSTDARTSPATRLLRLEITESSIMADPQRARTVLQGLERDGIRLSIDDFGTGYSSLAYLKDLPVSEVKIDRSFVTKVVEREGDQIIVRSIIDLGRNLGLTTVAEGVESHAALAWLQSRRLSPSTGLPHCQTNDRGRANRLDRHSTPRGDA